MQTYAKEKHLGAALQAPTAEAGKSIELPAAALQWAPQLDSAAMGRAWQQRDTLIEVVVPLQVLEALGKDVCAGALVHIASAAYPESRHIARLVPVELCAGPLLPPAAAAALDVDPATCVDGAKRPVALLSPFLAFNLGLPYHLAQLMPGESLARLLHARGSRVTLTTFAAAPPGDLVLRGAWTPCGAVHEVPAAAEVTFTRVAHPVKPPPFSIEDHVDSMQAMASAMSGAAAAPPEPKDDDEPDELQKAEQAASESDIMEV